MGDFFQNGVITTLHGFDRTGEERLVSELEEYTRTRPLCLVLPCLYSELQGPALGRIVDSLKDILYVNRIVVTLGEADETRFRKALEYFGRLKQPTKVIWNDGPRVSGLRQRMRGNKLYLGEPGKGLAAWMAFGLALGDGNTRAIALHDCDIVTYSPILLHRLVYPVINPQLDYQFCKGYYSRVTDRLHGRVTRIFVTPLLRALQKVVGSTPFLRYLDCFRYPLAGEFAMNVDVARINRIPANWGLEVGTLSEVYRNYSERTVCQVDLEIEYEHKHQDAGIESPKTGLMKMAREIASTLLHALASDGCELSPALFASLRAAYLRSAQDAIRQYSDVSMINGLVYDRHTEDTLAENFSRALEGACNDYLDNPLGSPTIPNWNRVESAMPGVLQELAEAVEADKGAFGPIARASD